MNKLLTLSILLLTITFSSNSYAENWSNFGNSGKGDNYYLDLENLRKKDGYLYFWVLVDFLNQTQWGDLSAKYYYQGDCGPLKVKQLSIIIYKKNMARGASNTLSPDQEWIYPPPSTPVGSLLKHLCD